MNADVWCVANEQEAQGISTRQKLRYREAVTFLARSFIFLDVL